MQEFVEVFRSVGGMEATDCRLGQTGEGVSGVHGWVGGWTDRWMDG